MSRNRTIWFDMDGVLADFDFGLAVLFNGKKYNELTSDEKTRFWNRGCVANDWYAKLDPIFEGIQLLRKAADYGLDVRILTSTGGGAYHYEIAVQKMRWIQEVDLRQRLPITFVTNSDKKSDYLISDAILIDDMESNIEQWCEAGGTGMRFSRKPDRLREIERYIRRLGERQ